MNIEYEGRQIRLKVSVPSTIPQISSYQYSDTHTIHIKSTFFVDTLVNGCDSIIWGDSIFRSSTGSGYIRFQSLASNGCDSITHLHLLVNHSSTEIESITDCDHYTWHGTRYTSSTNSPTYVTTNVVGCDSITTLHLTINYSDATTELIIACDQFTWIDHAIYTESTNTPTVTLTNRYGCDSTVTLNLTLYKKDLTGMVTDSNCYSYYWKGHTYTESGTYTFDTLTTHGCDSTCTLFLTIWGKTFSIDSYNVCDSIRWHGNLYTASTDAPTYDTLNSHNCDSTVRLNLHVRYSTHNTVYATACESYLWERTGETYRISGSYPSQSYINDSNCPSTDTLRLVVYGATVPPVRDLVVKNLGTDSPKMVLYPRNANETDYAYQWFKDSMTIEGATKQYYLLDGEDIGSHTFSVYVSPVEQVLCGSTSSKEITLTGVSQTTLTVSPNPNNGVFEIAFSSPEEHAREIDIYSQTGCKVHESTLHENVARIQEQLPTGIYTLKLTTDKGNTYTQKIIVK